MAQREVLAVMNKASPSAPKTSSKGRSGTLMESISPPRSDRKADVATGEYNAVLASDPNNLDARKSWRQEDEGSS
ncbi:MAG TPA: hypothetical protein VGE93_15715 [Bryobacteraceae bacterium]